MMSLANRWASGKRGVLAAMALLLLGTLSGCKPQNEDFDPHKKYGEDIRSFSDGRIDALPYFVGKDTQPVWAEQNLPPEGALKIPDFRFEDQNGKDFGTSQLKGRIFLANFFFTTCNGICPRTMPRLRRVQSELTELQDFALVSYSVTPEIDTPEVLHEYAEKMSIDDKNWHLLTGEREKIYELARRSFRADTKVRSRKGAEDFLHSEQAFLVDRKRYLRGIYNVQGPQDLEKIIRDIRLLSGELQGF
ncbi:MAG: SCO family protein [Leptospiraceae bacterium]|nr:SCO family protein [Leptospiraceae bacterium]